jgi:hypothetical protein
MTAIKTAMLETTNKGTSHGTHFLKTDLFWYGGGEPTLFSRLGCTLISTMSFPAPSLPIITLIFLELNYQLFSFIRKSTWLVGADGERERLGPERGVLAFIAVM